MRLAAVLFAAAFVVWPLAALGDGHVRTSHALSLFDDIKYPADFSHFDYANPEAPKGGAVKRHSIGSSDSIFRCPVLSISISKKVQG